MSYQNNILSFDSSASAERKMGVKAEHRRVVDGCRVLAANTIPRLLEGMFEKLDDDLYELADKAESNQRQISYFDAMREVRKDRERISAGFREQLLTDYDGFWRSGRLETAQKSIEVGSESGEFALIENDALEEGLAINNIVARSESRYYRYLYELNQRFAYLRGTGDMDVKDNPLAPAALTAAFHEQIRALRLDVQVKLVIYKLFQRKVMDALEGFYGDLNKMLVREGILVKLATRIKRSGSHVAVRPATAGGGAWGDGGGGQPGDPEDDVAGLQVEMFHTLRQLLSRKRGVEAPSETSFPALDTTEVLRALSMLQQDHTDVFPASIGPGPVDMDLRSDLFRVMGSSQGIAGERRLSGNDEDAIDVIAMLFEFILEDRNLPDAMKALLSRLQIPMLKAAILDKTFFHRKNHPARRLLNAMAKAAVGWSGDANRDEGGLYNKMSAIVETVLTGFDNNVDIFSELNDDFSAYLESEDQGSLKTEQRVTQITQGKEQLKTARHRVFEEINSRMFGRDGIPMPVISLVKEGWRDVLLLVYLRKGVESDEWKQALGLLDKLLWSVAPKPNKSQRQALLTETPSLLKGLRTGLNEISFDQHKMAKLFKDLQACHLCCLKGEDPAVKMGAGTGLQETAASPPSQDTGTNDMPGKGYHDESVVRDEYFELAESMAIGTWLDVKEVNGMTFRAKLSWRSIVSGTCLFVNRKGQKVVEIPINEFASWLRTGKAWQLEEADVPLMDRALNAMMDVLKKTEKPDSLPPGQISEGESSQTES